MVQSHFESSSLAMCQRVKEAECGRSYKQQSHASFTNHVSLSLKGFVLWRRSFS